MLIIYSEINIPRVPAITVYSRAPRTKSETVLRPPLNFMLIDSHGLLSVMQMYTLFRTVDKHKNGNKINIKFIATFTLCFICTVILWKTRSLLITFTRWIRKKRSQGTDFEPSILEYIIVLTSTHCHCDFYILYFILFYP